MARVPFRGVTLDQPTVNALLLAERLLGYPLELTQGSWSTGVAASAGTHAGAGAVDVHVIGLSDLEQSRIVRALRQAGFAAWRRRPDQGFVYHVHCILVGDGGVSSAAAQQLVQWSQHRDGLAQQGPDDDQIDLAAGRPAVLPPGATVARTMHDAVTVGDIPSGATMVAGYVDGIYANMPAMIARFPGAVHVPIAVRASTNDGLVLDVETGDATPAQAVGWVQMRRAAGVDPSVYCNTGVWPSVRAAFAAAGVKPPHYWVAQYDGNPAIPAGAVAKQYADVGPYDLSSVADVWPGVDIGADVSTPADIAKAVWDHMETNHASGQPVRMGTVLAWSDFERQQAINAVEANTAAALAPLNAALATVVADLTAISALLTGLESPTAVQVQQGLDAGLRQLGAILSAIPTA